MKKIITLLLSLISLSAFAQYKPDAVYKSGSSIYYIENGEKTNANLISILGQDDFGSYQTGRSLWGWGVGLSVAGAAITAFGIGAGVSSMRDALRNDDKKAYNTYKNQATAVISGGAALIIPGIVLSAIGNAKIKHVIERYNLSVTPTGISMNF